MRVLLDTNIFLEIILDQDRASEAKTLLAETGAHEFFMSDFSLHSIGLLLFRRNSHEVFRQFTSDVMVAAGTQVVGLPTEEMDAMVCAAQQYTLDFDDAYQYAVAQKHKLTIVSFDGDFDRTDVQRRTPAQIA